MSNEGTERNIEGDRDRDRRGGKVEAYESKEGAK